MAASQPRCLRRQRSMMGGGGRCGPETNQPSRTPGGPPCSTGRHASGGPPWPPPPSRWPPILMLCSPSPLCLSGHQETLSEFCLCFPVCCAVGRHSPSLVFKCPFYVYTLHNSSFPCFNVFLPQPPAWRVCSPSACGWRSITCPVPWSPSSSERLKNRYTSVPPPAF